MYKYLRMICAVLAAALVLVCIFVGIYFGLTAFIGCAAGALLLFVLSMFFKYLQEEQEEKKKAAQGKPAADDAEDDNGKDND